MMYRPNRQVDVPTTDLPSWVFGNEASHPDPDRPLLIDALDPTRSISFAQARTYVRSMIKGLHGLGIGQGSCVCLHLYNIYYPLLFLAIIGAGAVYVGSNPAYKAIELTRILETSGANLVIAAPDLLSAVETSTEILKLPDSDVLVFAEPESTPEGYRSWRELFRHGEDDWVRFDDEVVAKRTPACFVSTSGTTGMPKLAVLSHHAWVALNSVVDEPEPKPYHVKRLISLPMFHTFAAPMSHLAPLREGHTTYIMPRFSMTQFGSIVERFGINEVLAVPPILVNWVTSAGPKSFLGRIRFVYCGGAPLDSVTVKKMYRLLAPDACIAQVYGMTEAGWISTLKWPERDESGSVGKLLPNVEARLINDDGDVVETSGHRGEICVRGPRVMSGYLGDANATANAFIDGWLRTGDVGMVDEKGHIFIVDRAKDIIKVRGWQVSPAELEGVLRAHPDIQDAAVIGMKRPDGSEVPKAYVVRGNDSDPLSEDAVKGYIAALLVGYKHLDGGVSFVDSIPKSISGKILRKLL